MMADGTGGASLLALLHEKAGATDDVYTVYLTAEWLSAVDALMLPRIAAETGPRKLCIIQRGDYELAVAPPPEALVLRLSEKQFREHCRRLSISSLPALVKFTKTEPATEAPVLPPSTGTSHDVDVNDADLSSSRARALELFEDGAFMEAAVLLTQVLMQHRTCTKSNFNLAVLLQTIDEVYFAVDYMLRVVEEEDHDAVAHTVLRTVLYPAEKELVLRGYEAILSRHDGHVRAAHSLATLHGEATSASADYVRQVFDHLADTFEDKLVNHLEYRVPWQIVDALQRCRALPASVVDGTSFRAVDLGCGTGLCGRLLRPHASWIAGIDLSPLMIEKTRETGFYEELETADILPYLAAQDDGSLDLVVSADVWIYVGALDKIFPLVAAKLRPNGWFAFSIELLSEGDGFVLASSGRFKHSGAYIQRLAAANNFVVTVEEAVAVRKESGEPIAGRVYVLQLPVPVQ